MRPLMVAALVLWTAFPACAEEIPRPSLAGHTFVSTDIVPDAFVRGYLRTSVGYAQAAHIDYPPLIVHGDTLKALDGNLVYALLGFEYQHALRDWMAVRVGFNMRSRLGTQVASLVSEGVTVTSGLDFGWLARLRQTQRTSLCGSLAVANQTVTIIDPRQFAEDVGDGVPNARLVDDVPTVRTAGSLRYAWAISRPFGLTLLAEGSYGESPRRRGLDSWEYGLGGSVDFDAGAAWNVPVGVALAYRRTSLPLMTTADDSDASETVLRLAYNGKSDFLVSLDILGVLGRENSKAESVWAGGVAVAMRYYF
jgi:hypothetical protein